MTASLTLTRPARPRALISLVPMIDVMLILLVFFMVTSTYLNLDMIPAAQRAEDAAPGAVADQQEGAGSVMIRIAADGTPVLRGQAHSMASLTQALAADPQVQVLILPSATARTQALISVMDAATSAGITRLRVIRLEARP